MNYQQTLDYLFKQLPMYQRIGKAAYKTDLDNTHKLCKVLNNPETKFKSIHIAGTNGKGSTSHMVASILQEAGYKVGLYTSPHLKDFRERIKINGSMIGEDEVVSFVKKYQSDFEKLQLSFFEWTVGLAFYYFANEKVDIAVIETGLGGRLDSTNVITPEVSVITNIGMDHTQFLGDTMAKIATEKAGIIKPNIPVVIGENQEEVKDVFLNKVKENNCDVTCAWEISKEYECDLKGEYQHHNIKTAVAIIQTIRNKDWKISEVNIIEGLKKVISNTGIMGRWQILQDSPTVICDTGHNESGIKSIVNQLTDLKYDNLHIVFGAVNDKEIEDILKLLPKNAQYYFCKANIQRALDARELHLQASRVGLRGDYYDSVLRALDEAKDKATIDDVIFIGGSTFVVAEVV